MCVLFRSSFSCSTAPADKQSGTSTVGSAKGSQFTRNIPGRSTVHGGPIRDRRVTGGSGYNGQGGVLPLETRDTSAMNANRLSFLNKLTSKFSRRYVDMPP